MSPPAHDSFATDPTRLDAHLRQCAFARGPMHRLRCVAEALDAFLAPRFVTLLTATMALMLVSLSFPA
jgi:hypothetical protein